MNQDFTTSGTAEIIMSVEEIFAGAIEKQSQAERVAFLDGACGKDAEVRKQVENLLEAHGGMESFLDNGLFTDQPTEMLGGVTESEGATIGNYKLLQRIGEGGFGVVYMAEQTAPVRRKVALKIIKPGMDTKEVVARFAAEQQALALMDHPNIAKVFDAGETDSARPYFVMELVKGVSITEYCDANHLATTDRIDLFMSVCNAVQHAHQKGVIHRDLKPSNVLVTLHDGKPVPKVIDFGVSKAISQQLTEKTMFTRYGQVIGTPQYMSPEQAEMSGLDVDTRSDVYSLGVLLYELLTGQPPFDSETLRRAGFDEMRRLIREQEPAKPSNVLRTLDRESATVVASHRASKPETLSKACRGDLDLIVMKSLEKDRNRRYATAVNLAEDLQRHLNNEPVQASPPSMAYLLKKSMYRHRAFWLTTATVFLALLAGVAIAWSGWRREAHLQRLAAAALKEAQAERIRAEKNEKIAELASQSIQEQMEALLTVLSKAGRDPDTGFEYKVSDALMEVDDLLFEIIGDSAQQETAVLTLMRLHTSLGRSQFEDHEFDQAIAHLLRALKAWRQVGANTGHVADPHDGTVILSLLGACHFHTGEVDEAAHYLDEAMEIIPENYRPKSISEIPHVVSFWVKREQGVFEDPAAEKERVFEQVAAMAPWEQKSYPWSNLGEDLATIGQPTLAQEAFDMAVKLGGELTRPKEVGFEFRARGMPAEALEVFEHNLRNLRKSKNHEGIVWGLIKKARVHCDVHDFATASTLLREAIRYSVESGITNEFTALAPTRELSMLLERYGDRGSAKELHKEVAARIRNQREKGDKIWGNSLNQIVLAEAELCLADDPPLDEWLPRLETIGESVNDPFDQAILDRVFGSIYERNDDLSQAVKWYEDAATGRTLFNEIDNAYWAEEKLLDLYRRLDDQDRAVEFFTRLVNQRSRDFHANHPTQAFTRMLLARAILDRDGQSPQLVSLLEEAKRLFDSHSFYPDAVKTELDELFARANP